MSINKFVAIILNHRVHDRQRIYNYQLSRKTPSFSHGDIRRSPLGESI